METLFDPLKPGAYINLNNSKVEIKMLNQLTKIIIYAMFDIRLKMYGKKPLFKETFQTAPL